jgi:hypothetical protein
LRHIEAITTQEGLSRARDLRLTPESSASWSIANRESLRPLCRRRGITKKSFNKRGRLKHSHSILSYLLQRWTSLRATIQELSNRAILIILPLLSSPLGLINITLLGSSMMGL